MGKESVTMNFVAQDFLVQYTSWFHTIFPSETGETLLNWFQVVLPFLVAVVLIMFICCCCRRRYAGGVGGKWRAGKMMKAPGKNFEMPEYIV